MINAIGVKVCLFPNKTQEEKLWLFSNHSRGLYNLLLEEAKRAYIEDGIKVSFKYLYSCYQMIKAEDKYSWIKDLPEASAKQVIKDLVEAYRRVFKSNFGFPKFKSKRKSKVSFYQRTDNLYFIDGKVNLTKIGRVRCQKGKYPESGFCNPRIIFDGKHWYLSFSTQGYFQEILEKEKTEGIGIDLGIKNLATVSNGNVFGNPNKENPELKRLGTKLNRLQRRYSRKLEKNKDGNKVVFTKNSEKLREEMNIIQRRIHNIKSDFYHCLTNTLVRTNPEFIAIEDLSIKDMKEAENDVSKYLQSIALYEVVRQLTYKSAYYNIPLVTVSKYFPSSKMCNNCGNILSNLSLGDRVYHCPVCGEVIDRDLNASLNIKSEGDRLLFA